MRLRNKKLPETMSNKDFNRYINNKNLRNAEQLNFYAERSGSSKFGVKVFKSDKAAN